MKSLLLVFLLLISVSDLHAQFRKEFLGELTPDLKKFPQTHRVFYNYQYNDYKYIQVKDSITNAYKTIVNTPIVKKSDQDYSYLFGQFSGYFSTNEFEESAPPLLDSLDDGIYIMYYSTIPVADQDTIKFRNDIVRAIIPITNNQVNGTVKWYYSNGLLMQESEYVNGRKQGATFLQDVSLLSKNEISYIHSAHKNYSKNNLDGESVEYFQLDPVFEGKNNPKRSSSKKTELFAKSISVYEDGRLNGKIAFHINNQLIFSGFYKDDKPSGKWEIYDWKVKNQKVVLTLRAKLEINDEELVSKENYFHRTTFNKNPLPFNGYSNFSSAAAGERLNAYQNFDILLNGMRTTDFQNSHTNFQVSNLGEVCYIPDCKNLGSIPQNYIRGTQIPRDFAYQLKDQAGNIVFIDDVAKECGTVFEFKNYTEFYPNGQLRCSFDFTKPEQLYASKVFYPNGTVMNEVKLENGIYHQYWFDSIGNVLEHSVHESNGKFIELVESSNFKTINGFYCRKLDQDWQFPGKTAYNLNQDTAFVYKASFNKDLSLKYIHRHDPKTGKGKIEKYDGKNAFLINEYYIDRERHEVTYDCRIKLGDFTISKHRTYNLDSVKFLTGIYDSITWQILNYLEYWSNDYLHTDIVYENGKPCTKQIKVIYGTDQKSRITSTKKRATIYCSDEYSSLIVNFLSSIETFLGSNYASDKNNHLSDEHYEKLKIRTLEFSLVNGKITGNIHRTSACGFPLETIYLNEGTIIKYNGYPQFDFSWEEDETHHYGDSVYSYISSITRSKAHEYKSVSEYNSLGKLIRFDSTNYITNTFLKNDQKDFIGFSFHKKDTIYLSYTLNYFCETKNHFEYNREKNQCQEYYKKGSIKTNYQITNGVVDLITTYDTLSNVISESKLVNGYMELQTNYKNGVILNTLSFDLKDSIQPLLRNFPSDLDKTLFVWNGKIKKDFGYMNIRSTNTEYSRSYANIYQNNRVVAEGELLHGAKHGLWKYSYPNQLPYTIEYRDTFVSSSEGLRLIRFSNYKDPLHDFKCHGTIAKIKLYSSSNELLSQGILHDFSQEYTCLQDTYTEQYMIDYSIYNGKSTTGITQYVVNHYPNGNKMNEGNLVNGKPDGLWKWYHNDGLLYEVGEYVNGSREGRWLKGDLSKVRFTGEMCLDPTTNEYKEILRSIEVQIIDYKNGKPIHFETHELGTDK